MSIIFNILNTNSYNSYALTSFIDLIFFCLFEVIEYEMCTSQWLSTKKKIIKNVIFIKEIFGYLQVKLNNWKSLTFPV